MKTVTYTNASTTLARRRKPKPVQVDDLEMIEVRVALLQRFENLWKLRFLKNRDGLRIRESLKRIVASLRKFSVINTKWEVVNA